MTQPIYTHDCDNCVYVGRFTYCGIVGDGYVCRTSVIWRTGEYGDYESMPIGLHDNSPVLVDIYNSLTSIGT
jgi:hypothetical protein